MLLVDAECPIFDSFVLRVFSIIKFFYHSLGHYDCHLCKATFHGASAKRNLENHVKKHMKNYVKKHPINGEIGKS